MAMETPKDGRAVIWLSEWQSRYGAGAILSALAAAYLVGLFIVQIRLGSLGIPRVSLTEPGAPGAAMLFLLMFYLATMLPKWTAGSYLTAVLFVDLGRLLLLSVPRPLASEWNPLGAPVLALLGASALCLLGRFCFPALSLAFNYALRLLLTGAFVFSRQDVSTLLLMLGWIALPIVAKRLAWNTAPLAGWLPLRTQRLTGLGVAAASVLFFAFFLYPLADAQVGGGAPVTAALKAAADDADAKPAEVSVVHQTGAGIYVLNDGYRDISFIPMSAIRSLALRPAGLPLPGTLFPLLAIAIVWLPFSAFLRHNLGDDGQFGSAPTQPQRHAG